MKPTIRRPAILATALCTLAALLAGASGRAAADRAPPRVIVKTTKIAPGLVFKRIIDKKLPRRTFVLVVDISRPLTLDVALGANALPARAETSAIAKRAGALAAINGDFTDRHAGRPVHPFEQDGQFLQTTLQLGDVFAVSSDEQNVYLGRPSVSVTATNTEAGRTWTLDRWNAGAPLPGEIAGYSPIGGSLEMPPDHACSVRLLPTGPLGLSTAPSGGIDQSFTVDQAACEESAMTRDGGVVLSAPPSTDEATELLSLAVGTPMTLHWTLGLTQVLDAVGGTPILVSDGQIAVGPTCGSLCRSNPRTGIGVRADGKILLVVVDGRQKKWSLGPTLYDFAKIMQSLGAVQALNLDGGGSTTMVVNGEVVNRPSDGFERRISNAVLILPGPDPGEP